MSVDDLKPGLYESLITRALGKRLVQFDPSRVVRRQLDGGDGHVALAHHVGQLLATALRGLSDDDRVQRQAELTNDLIALLSSKARQTGDPDEAVEIPPEELRAIKPPSGGGLATVNPPFPIVALSASDLMVNARGEPALAHALGREIPSADSIDLLCAFVRWHGLRVLEAPLAAHLAAHRPVRVLTTVYTGSTERKALDWLVARGAQVKVSYDTQSTRLHAKAWLFKRDTGYSTAYIGSSNLSKSALIDGVEWNVRLSEVTSREVLEKFAATFDNYWSSAEYEDYDPERDRDRLDRALSPGAADTADEPLLFLDVEPWPHQREMLEKLAVERERHHRHRNLVVAATGTGKTIVAALDYKNLQHGGAAPPSAGVHYPSLLFVAHRHEILKQSLGAFRQVLRKGDFGELHVDGRRPEEGRVCLHSISGAAGPERDRPGGLRRRHRR